MAKAGTRRKNVRVILPDSDKLGFVVASFFSTLVLAINLFVHSIDWIEAAYRVSLTFAVAWLVAAIAVHCMVTTTVEEIRAEKAARRKARLAEEELAEQEEAGEPPIREEA